MRTIYTKYKAKDQRNGENQAVKSRINLEDLAAQFLIQYERVVVRDCDFQPRDSRTDVVRLWKRMT